MSASISAGKAEGPGVLARLAGPAVCVAGIVMLVLAVRATARVRNLERRLDALSAGGPQGAGSDAAMRAVVKDAESRWALSELRRRTANLRLEAEVAAAGVAATASLGHGLAFDLRAAERAVDAVLIAEKERFRAESAKRWRSKLMQSVPKYVVQLDKAIPLTGEQKERIEAILAEGYGIQADAMAEAEEPGIVAYGLTDLRADCERRVRAVLTPEQLQRFEKFDKSWLPGWGKN